MPEIAGDTYSKMEQACSSVAAAEERCDIVDAAIVDASVLLKVRRGARITTRRRRRDAVGESRDSQVAPRAGVAPGRGPT